MEIVDATTAATGTCSTTDEDLAATTDVIATATHVAKAAKTPPTELATTMI